MLDEEPEVASKWGDQYVNAEILLPRRDKVVRGGIIHQKWNADGNSIGRSSMNSILKTPLYEVDFPGGKMTELTANIIAESIRAQSAVNGNDYLLLEAFIDH